MLKFKSREEILNQYVSRYPELDRQFMNRLSEEYGRYMEILKDAASIEEYKKVFEEEIKENERRYKDNEMLRGLEDSPYNQYMEILAHYGLIVFFRDNLLNLD